MYLQFSRSSANNDQARSMLYYYCKTCRLLCAASKVTKPSRRRKSRRGRSAAAPKATSQGTATASPSVAVVLKGSQKTLLDSQMGAADYNKNAKGGPNTFIAFVKQLAVSRFGRIVMLGVYSLFGAILFVTVEGAKQEDVVVTAEATIS